MKNITKKDVKGLDQSKRHLLKALMGSASTVIDLNKIRNEWKYGEI